MTDTLDAILTPAARMAEIRRLVAEAATKAIEAGQAHVAADQAAAELDEMWCQLDLSDRLWQEHDALIVELLEHLQRAEERGELAECEAMLTVSFGGRA